MSAILHEFGVSGTPPDDATTTLNCLGVLAAPSDIGLVFVGTVGISGIPKSEGSAFLTSLNISKLSDKRVVTPGDFYITVVTGAAVSEFGGVLSIDQSPPPSLTEFGGYCTIERPVLPSVIEFGGILTVESGNVVVQGDWYFDAVSHLNEVVQGDFYFDVAEMVFVYNDWYFDVKDGPVLNDWYFDVDGTRNVYNDFEFDVIESYVTEEAKFRYSYAGGSGASKQFKITVDLYQGDNLVLTKVARISAKSGSTVTLVVFDIPNIFAEDNGIFVAINYEDVVGEYYSYQPVKEVSFPCP